MAEFVLKIDIDNAAFDPDPSEEIARLLVKTKDLIEAGATAADLRDVNGNLVGHWYFDE